MHLSIANAPTSWGVEDAAGDHNPPWAQFLDEVAGAGYQGVELGPLGYLPDKDFVLQRELELRRLQLAAGSLFEPLHDPDDADAARALARRTCRLVAAAGARCLVVIQGFTPEREQAAGRPGAAVGLDREGWRQMIDAVHEIARTAREEHGLTACFHPHAGTHVEFEDEVDRLMYDTDPELVGLCIDTGHSAYTGIDPVGLYRRYADRVRYLHLKDVNPMVLEASLKTELSFEQAVARGAFCPIGRGVVDFEALSLALGDHGYSGWATVEQDLLSASPRSPAQDARTSLERLHAVGLAGAGR